MGSRRGGVYEADATKVDTEDIIYRYQSAANEGAALIDGVVRLLASGAGGGAGGAAASHGGAASGGLLEMIAFSAVA